MKPSNLLRSLFRRIEKVITSRWPIIELPDVNGNYLLGRSKRHSPLSRMFAGLLLTGAGAVAIFTVTVTLVRGQVNSPSGSIFLFLFGLAFILYGIYLFYVGINQNRWRKLNTPELLFWMKAKYRKPKPARGPVERKRFTIPPEE